jgi:photosystem II oxygen-evolving enhancer protein 2
MWKRIALTLLVTLGLVLQLNVTPAAAAGYNSFIENTQGYKFLYPNGWVSVKVGKGADIVFHDLIEPSENVSVVIGQVDKNKQLSDLGNASDVGLKLAQKAIAPPDSGRSAELISANTIDNKGKTYYLLEYDVALPNKQHRHNLASVVISRGKLFTFNVTTTDRRWNKMKSTLTEVVSSFNVA